MTRHAGREGRRAAAEGWGGFAPAPPEVLGVPTPLCPLPPVVDETSEFKLPALQSAPEAHDAPSIAIPSADGGQRGGGHSGPARPTQKEGAPAAARGMREGGHAGRGGLHAMNWEVPQQGLRRS